MVVDQGDTPLFLGAIHRVLFGSSLDDVAASARSVDVGVVEDEQHDAVAGLGPGTLVATDGDRWLRLDVGSQPDRVEVELLHDRVVPALAHGPTRVTHHHTAADALGHASPGIATAMQSTPWRAHNALKLTASMAPSTTATAVSGPTSSCRSAHPHGHRVRRPCSPM